MKTYSFRSLGLGLALSAVPFVAGCSSQSQGESVDASNATAPAEAVQPAIAAPVKDTLPPPAPPARKTLPASISNPSPSFAEVIKLTHAGVDESVMLAFVNGSQSAFNLGSDEIIYLSDLGVPDAVMTAMMDRDSILKQPWAPPTQVAAAAAETPRYVEAEVTEEPIAAAPSYVNPPQSVPEQQPVVVNNNYFYETLAPYGSWVNLSGYGWCWQPTVAVVNSNWRPYGDRGRWAYTSAGWYWQSDYSWGMTFQYGRWFNQPNRGWCWAPDTVWAPSWVTWRYNSSYCGWAPLPPSSYYRTGVGLSYSSGSVGIGFSFGLSSDSYTFVGWNNFCSPRPYRYYAPRSQNAVIANNSTVINNYVTGDGNTIINHGVAPEQVTQYSGRQVPRTSLEEARTRRGAGWQARNSDTGTQTTDSRSSRGLTTGSQRSGNRTAGINTLADAGGNQAFRPAAAATRERAQTQENDNNNRPSSFTRSASTPQPQRDRIDSRDSGSPRPGLPERGSRPASLIVNGSSASAGRGQTATAQTAPSGSLILNGEPDNNNSSRNNNSRYVPPSSGRSLAALEQRPSTPIQRETPQTQVRSSMQRPSLPQTATAWTPPATQRTPSAASSQNAPRIERVDRPAQIASSRPAVSSRQHTPAAPAVSRAPQQVGPTPSAAPSPARQRISAPQVQAPRPSPTINQSSPRVESRPAPSPRVESSARQNVPASPARQSSGKSGWENRGR